MGAGEGRRRAGRQAGSRRRERRGSREIMKARGANGGLMERFDITRQERRGEKRRGGKKRWLSFI